MLFRRRVTSELINNVYLKWLNLAEEIDALAGNTRRELSDRLARLLQHLLKSHYPPKVARSG
jgi:Domain of unknown function DUF29